MRLGVINTIRTNTLYASVKSVTITIGTYLNVVDERTTESMRKKKRTPIKKILSVSGNRV